MNLDFSQILKHRKNLQNPNLPSNNYMHVCITEHTRTDSINLALVNFYFNMLICTHAHKVIFSSVPLPLIPKFSTPTTSLCAWGRAGLLTGVRTYQSAFVPEPRHHVLLSWPLQRDNSVQRQIQERAFGPGQRRGRAAAARSQAAGIKLERQVFPKLYTHRIQSASSYVANLGKAASPLSHTQANTHIHTHSTNLLCLYTCLFPKMRLDFNDSK